MEMAAIRQFCDKLSGCRGEKREIQRGRERGVWVKQRKVLQEVYEAMRAAN